MVSAISCKVEPLSRKASVIIVSPVYFINMKQIASDYQLLFSDNTIENAFLLNYTFKKSSCKVVDSTPIYINKVIRFLLHCLK